MLLAAAAGDFTAKRAGGKIDSAKKLALNLTPAQKISESARKWSRKARLVLFKAESGVSDAQLRKAAEKKMKKCGADLIVANDISRKGAGFGVGTNEVLIVGRKGAAKVKGTKAEIAEKLFGSLGG